MPKNSSQTIKHLISLMEFSAKETGEFIDLGIKVKKNPEKFANSCKNLNLAMLFQKTSTRTRVSFEAGFAQMGGHAIFLDYKSIQFALGAAISDEINCIAGYCNIIMARVYKNGDIEAMAQASKVPVINGLSDLWHPCQALADFMTLKEKFGNFKKVKLAYVGDGNNVCNSLIVCAAKLGVQINVATPKGFEPCQEAIEIGKKAGVLKLFNNAEDAVNGANVVYTDTWASMGHESEIEKRIEIFKPFQANKELMAKSNNAFFMHCLPAHRGFEVTDEVIDSKQSIVFDQAENRMHVQKAVILKLLNLAK